MAKKSKNPKKLTLFPRYHWIEGTCQFLGPSDPPVAQKTVQREKSIPIFWDFSFFWPFIAIFSPNLGVGTPKLGLKCPKLAKKSKNPKKLTLFPGYHWIEGTCQFLGPSDPPVAQKTVQREKSISIFRDFSIHFCENARVGANFVASYLSSRCELRQKGAHSEK